jgi:two-component system, cell cycle response regulator
LLVRELQQASARIGARATRSRTIGTVGEITAIAFMLGAFSLTLFLSTRLAREKHRLLIRSQAEALTDALTGLANRRALFLDMKALIAESPPLGGLALGMLDLDGFKRYNDTFGHPAGDALLARLGSKLAATMNGYGSAYRMGGDEFCVIAHGPDPDPEHLLAAAALALSEHGEGFAVSCSLGSVVFATDEVTLEQALQQADQRLYDNKRSARKHGDGEAHDVLLRILAENSASLATHLTTVGRLAEAVARRLGLSDEEVTLTRLTAELHDIGKTAIPDSILDTAGPLDQSEWAFMKRHTIIGERILAAAPALSAVAPLVRSSHERTDGTGYPDGLREDEIPVSSRIVAVVDAYDAMTSKRPYSLPRTPDEAIAELRRCAGSQFDVAVAEAFIAVWQESPRPAWSSGPTDPSEIAA